MSIDLYEKLYAQFGCRLGVADLAYICNMTPGSVRTAISAERFPIKTYKEGKFRLADVRDVVTYLDNKRASAI